MSRKPCEEDQRILEAHNITLSHINPAEFERRRMSPAA